MLPRQLTACVCVCVCVTHCSGLIDNDDIRSIIRYLNCLVTIVPRDLLILANPESVGMASRHAAAVYSGDRLRLRFPVHKVVQKHTSYARWENVNYILTAFALGNISTENIRIR